MSGFCDECQVPFEYDAHDCERYQLKSELAASLAREQRLWEAIASALTSLATGPLKDGYAYAVLDEAIRATSERAVGEDQEEGAELVPDEGKPEMMERTELRESFFAEVRRDPYAHMLTTLFTDMWAEGYKQAERDLRADPDALDRYSHSDLRDRAAEWLTDSRRRTEAVIAMAQIGSMLPEKHS